MRTAEICTIFIFTIAGCAAPPTNQSLVYSPPLTIKLVKLEATNDCHAAFFEMKNVGDQTLWYSGEKLSDGHMDFSEPTCIVQHKGYLGGWYEFPNLSWCNMGEGIFKLEAGQTTNFKVNFTGHLAEGFRFRVGVRAGTSSYAGLDSMNPIYWSDTVMLSP
jgi:hypothetical protein